tara:strand:+ start:253 stop:456 length:204 start_codon:yes stop_codon:yes gene_type:complete
MVPESEWSTPTLIVSSAFEKLCEPKHKNAKINVLFKKLLIFIVKPFDVKALVINSLWKAKASQIDII